MSMAPKIVLHVGAPKTGSTYLQRKLRANRDRLRDHGIYIPVLPLVEKMAVNAKLLATALSQQPSLSFQRAFPEIDVATLNPRRVLVDLLDAWRPSDESVVLSAENMQPKHAHRLRELLPATAPCCVVLFVRRQDRWVDSYYNQLIKTNDIDEDIETFVARVCDNERGRFCCPDWDAHYEAWRDAFGSCNVVFYDEVMDDVFAAFMKAAGLQDISGLDDVERAQVSLDNHQLGYLRELQRPIAYFDFVRRRSASEQSAQCLGGPDSLSLLSTENLVRLRTRFESSNHQLLKALGRSAGTGSLEIDVEHKVYCDLRQLYSSPEYARHRELADALYAGKVQRAQ